MTVMTSYVSRLLAIAADVRLFQRRVRRNFNIQWITHTQHVLHMSAHRRVNDLQCDSYATLFEQNTGWAKKTVPFLKVCNSCIR